MNTVYNVGDRMDFNIGTLHANGRVINIINMFKYLPDNTKVERKVYQIITNWGTIVDFEPEKQ